MTVIAMECRGTATRPHRSFKVVSFEQIDEPDAPGAEHLKFWRAGPSTGAGPSRSSLDVLSGDGAPADNEQVFSEYFGFLERPDGNHTPRRARKVDVACHWCPAKFNHTMAKVEPVLDRLRDLGVDKIARDDFEDLLRRMSRDRC